MDTPVIEPACGPDRYRTAAHFISTLDFVGAIRAYTQTGPVEDPADFSGAANRLLGDMERYGGVEPEDERLFEQWAARRAADIAGGYPTERTDGNTGRIGTILKSIDIPSPAQVSSETETGSRAA